MSILYYIITKVRHHGSGHDEVLSDFPPRQGVGRDISDISPAFASCVASARVTEGSLSDSLPWRRPLFLVLVRMRRAALTGRRGWA